MWNILRCSGVLLGSFQLISSTEVGQQRCYSIMHALYTRTSTPLYARLHYPPGSLLILACMVTGSDLDTSELAGVVAVCGGTVIILFLVWVGICYSHWKTERDFCQFKNVSNLQL